MSGPYRDENESLRAEVVRLRAELGARRVSPAARGKLALLLVAVDFGAIMALRPWLNGGSDVKLWAGAAVVVGIAIAALAAARGFRRKS